jgi:6-pyruvoyl-tetrahydropterin synthase-like protein
MTSPAGSSENNLNRGENFRGWLLAMGVLLGTALLVVSPFFWLGNASGHDIAFHASSWLDVAGQWKEGIVYPRWTEWANHGFGEPRFIFYPPLSWMLGAALSFVAPGNAVPGVFIVLVQTFAGISAFVLIRKFLTRGAALIGAVCYAANPYALLIVYMRSDFAELLACALMPLLMLAALQVCGLLENRQRSLPRAIAFFAVTFAGVWLSNAPAGVMASYSVALVFAWAAVMHKSWRPLWRGAAGLALGFGLTGFYLVPAAYEQSWVNISEALSSGLLPAQNFLYTRIADPEHNDFNSIASNVAALLMAMTGIACVAAWRRAKIEAFSSARLPCTQNSGEKEKMWRVMLLLAAAASILMLRPTEIFWEHLPKLRFVQFPWRWMAILAVPYAYFLAVAITRWRSGWILAAAVLIAVGGTATFLVHKAWWDSDDIPSLQDAIEDDKGFEGTDEYDPAGDDHSNLPEKAARVQILPAEESEGLAPAAEVQIQRWTAEDRIVSVISREPIRVALRLLDYPAWRVDVNGTMIRPEHAETAAQMILPLPAGTQQIRVKFVRTPDRTWGMLLSMIAVLILLALLSAGGLRLLSASP